MIFSKQEEVIYKIELNEEEGECLKAILLPRPEISKDEREDVWAFRKKLWEAMTSIKL